ncbi:Z1 domain-containing protein [Hamadaea sp. NPDC050747]|uniref:Z1 domain-containing protein n=1 Tax=Hamadaea sp. NPDC050747 TaxID=3155789 RepID=UPI0033D0A31F
MKTPDAEDVVSPAIRLVMAMLPQDRQPTAEEVRESVDVVCVMQQKRGFPVDYDQLLREVQAKLAVWQEDSVGLSDSRNHIDWLPQAEVERPWEFWERYKHFLQDVKLLPPPVVRQLDKTTGRILRQLEDPQRAGRWRRTGLAVGQVQSGKTGNYIGLACKAADAGYKLIIILAGIHNSLRSQTQLRVDEGLLGFDTQFQLRSDEATHKMGVGALPLHKRLKIASLTNSAEKGDFKRNVASNINLPVGDVPIVLVVKKHKSILEYIRKWIVEVEGQEAGDNGEKLVYDVPALIIDDEADHASVDTSKEDDTDPTKINAAIRRLLNSFEKAAYVGFTATPFANIYIDPEAEHDVLGQDLFPISFIESLRAPTNYLGPEKIFGIRFEDSDSDDVPALPVTRPTTDYQDWMPSGHKKDWVPPDELPVSLKQALLSFALTCAARRARGQVTEHNSMLIHVTRFISVQNRVREQIDDYIALIADRLRDGRGAQAASSLARLRELWEQDFVPTTLVFPADEASRFTWQQIEPHLLPALRKIQVRAVNGSAQDALQYYDNRKAGLSVIAIGGDKLSRGLTLEGLSVSYYLRASNTYDTLLQMGRWFGYRPGYEDLCRLYTTKNLLKAYTEITAADNELRRDFEEMSALGETPETFGLRVRSSSAGLAVTAQNKMRRGIKVKLSYSGELPETTTFSLKADVVTANFKNLSAFITRLDELGCFAGRSGSGVLWSNVPASEVIDGFLEGYRPDRRSYRVRPALISEYIRRCIYVNELTSWSVLLAGGNGSQMPIGSRTVPLVTRGPAKNKLPEEGQYTVRRVLSPSDESVDLTKEQFDNALAETKLVRQQSAQRRNKPYVEPTVPSGQPLRRHRNVNQPLLIIYPITHPSEGEQEPLPLIGFAISFPLSENSEATEYVVNTIWQQEMNDMDAGDDE